MINDRNKLFQALQPFAITLLAMLTLSCTAAQAQDSSGRRAGRLSPPDTITCDRNQLTSYTGEVTGYRREEHASWLEISTDEGTIEQVSIDHDEAADATAHYLLWSDPFPSMDWDAIETTPGKLIQNMRATAWICQDGTAAPVVDWKPRRD